MQSEMERHALLWRWVRRGHQGTQPQRWGRGQVTGGAGSVVPAPEAGGATLRRLEEGITLTFQK